MKKLSLYIFLVLMWCNTVYAYVLSNCYGTVNEGFNNKIETELNTEWYEEFYFSIDTTNGVASEVYIWKDEYLEDFNRKYPGSKREKIYMSENHIITYADKRFIKAEHLKKEFMSNFLSQFIFDLEKNTVKFIHTHIENFIEGLPPPKKHKPWWIVYQCESETSSGDVAETSGTAFFINNKGNLITNNHVVEGCELSKINYFNKEYDTNLISTDKTLDLALLKVDLKPKDFISFSNKEPRKRQTIIVAGYPLGKYLSDDLKINEGKISSLKGFENNSNEITVDLAINPGNSGGPIVDENGQLVAVAVAGMSKDVTEGISFGIKSSAVTNFLKTNNISPDIKLTSFSMNDEKVNQLLEESTVYIFCE